MIEEERSIIRPAQLIELYNIGFKLVPLGDDSKPVIQWTPIYEDTSYWTPQKIVDEASKFKNVATVFDKTHIKDSEGKGLYLNELDIDSQNVYDILFASSAFIDNASKNTFVVKTKKTSGYRIFWFSHTKNEPIHTQDCKPGFEFEIKTDKSCGHSTLPPSCHREDPNFHYENRGQNKIAIQDELYNELIKTLAECLHVKQPEPTEKLQLPGNGRLQLSDAEIEIISSGISQYYKKPRRHGIVLALSGLFHKYNVSKDSTIALIETLAKDDPENDKRPQRCRKCSKRDES